jgi:hypothetical protein
MHFALVQIPSSHCGHQTSDGLEIWRISHIPQKDGELPEYLSSPPVFSGVHVTRSLALCVCFVDRYLSFCTLSYGHCVVYSS